MTEQENNKDMQQRGYKSFFVKLVSISIAIVIVINLLFNLIFSLKNQMLNRTTHKGPLKAIAVTSASCKFLNPIKIAAMAMAPKKDR